MKSKKLLEEYRINDHLNLKNRIVMAPMTRASAQKDGTPTSQMKAYYTARADAGLIITEGTIISSDATGYANVPGIFNQQHIDQWRKVTTSVHQSGGEIFLQIWHVGRVSHPFFLNGDLPISASETVMKGRIRRSEGLNYGTSREATLSEINEIVSKFARAASNAIEAGFDGVEIHGANGYLIDQFLHYHTNLRDDKYGKTPENMCRFALEVVQECGEAIGHDRVGIRLSPGGYLHEIEGDSRDAMVFSHLLSQLSNLGLAYVHTGNFDDTVKFSELGGKTMTSFIREHYNGTVIACGGYKIDEVQNKLEQDQFDLVALGKPFIANPDLVNRYKNGDDIKPYVSEMLNTLK